MEKLHMEELGKYVRERREELGLSQEDVARNGGPSTTTLSKLENGEMKQMRRRTARDLERALGWRAEEVWYVLLSGNPPRVALAAVGDEGAEARSPVPSYLSPYGDAVEGTTVRMESDENGARFFVGSSYWVDSEGRPWKYEVRFWPAPDVGSYPIDFSMVLNETGRSLQDHMPIVRQPATTPPRLLPDDLTLAAKRAKEGPLDGQGAPDYA